MRRYFHRAQASLFIMEMDIGFSGAASVTIPLQSNTGKPSSDISFQAVTAPAGVVAFNGSIITPEVRVLHAITVPSRYSPHRNCPAHWG